MSRTNRYQNCIPAAVVLAACFLLLASPAAASPQKVIDLPKGLKPEGVASGWGAEVYVGGLAGLVTKTNVISKETQVVANLSGLLPLPGVFAGLKVSKEANLMFVAGGISGMAWVYIMNPSTGLVASGPIPVPLNPPPQNPPPAGPTTLINDVSLRTVCTGNSPSDCQVTAYFTDSFAPNIYEVSGCPNNCQVVTYRDPAFEPVPVEGVGSFGLNGIVTKPLPEDTLVVGHLRGTLYKVTLAGGAVASVTPVAVSDEAGQPVPYLPSDGLLMTNDRVLYVVWNLENKVAKLRFAGDLQYTAARIESVVGDALFVNPTTVAVVAGKLYVVNGHMYTPGPNICPPLVFCPENSFELVRVDGL